jgi:protein phosphatase
MFLLCTDGLSGMLTEAGMADILRTESQTIGDTVEQLVTAANAAGGLDNITVILLAVREETAA